MQVNKQISLLPFNTFGIDARVDTLITIEHSSDLYQIGEELQKGMIIGGGSNILLSKPRYSLALINRIKGISVENKNEGEVTIAAGSGENWHELVLWSLTQNYGGLENLSLIPGTVGAGPIQNIGAYGVEIKDILVGLDFFWFGENRSEFISVDQCQLQYRDSIFKNEWKNRGLITKVYLKLTTSNHQINTEYLALKKFLEDQNSNEPTIHEISKAVIKIRESKLPDWRKIGNAGSFFKNPVISRDRLKDLQTNYPRIPYFEVENHAIKIPAAWLIQETGFKGIRRGHVGTYPFQPLVLVNYGGATAAELLKLKDEIQNEVAKRFDIFLEPEVTIL